MLIFPMLHTSFFTSFINLIFDINIKQNLVFLKHKSVDISVKFVQPQNDSSTL